MKSLELKGALRKDLGKSGAKKLRKEKKVPCVLYGGKENIHFSLDENELRHLVYTSEVYFADLNIEGEKYKGIMQELQLHPVSDRINHIDFVQVFEDKKVTAKLPIILVGNSIGVKNGGKLRWKMRTMAVKGFPKDLPEQLKVDITDLEIGQTIKVSDVSFANITTLDTGQSLIVSVVSSRVVAKGMAAEDETPVQASAEAPTEVPTETTEG